ncbi:MAG: TIGR03087 family PEP-CTERM/XrtA system glycosyltransferase [Hydrogenophaga sp.]|uniref:TIGR03087 family PEP-CTERM/XrtA system glycosyltransferase n=1 Tax=Hydrogenophaga sp. TaxID=1904254 RepID=UPI001D2DE7A0|nr:TIGR03087 family PEP-CTERM/XrtA system glycosyltransferase [Hydrogenophaga sp.]MBX3610158.1 TIGR03087 family PEP-CTERM/XrtA system glycosyltransferase [Hydrogenophaga sp.]
MANLLYLVHRMPYPPDKGDKVRSYHLLRHLQQRHRVFLGTFIDDLADEQHLDALRQLCPDLHVARIQPRWRKLASLQGLLRGEALSLAYYRDAGLMAWVRQVAAQHDIRASIVFSSTMSPFALGGLPGKPMLVDIVDVDSAKWTQYAPAHRWPLSWLYRREGLTLLAHERATALAARRSYFVTPQECELFASLAPDCRDRVTAMGNGVNASFFQPDVAVDSPFAEQELPIVFTGAMDYWPNVDGVRWFAEDMLPAIRQRYPRARFWIVGRNPTPAVQALTSDAVSVTGTVPDVRPYLKHAAAVVAPLRVARGLQNKILEGMAMAQPVVTVSSCADAIGAQADEGLCRADTVDGFVNQVCEWLANAEQRWRVGEQARRFVLDHFSWDAHLSVIDRDLAGCIQLDGAADLTSTTVAAAREVC